MFPPPSRIGQRGATTPLLPASEEDLLWRFLDRAPVALLVADDDRTISAVTAPWSALFGYPAGEVVGKRLDDLLAAESKPGIAMRWSDLVAAGAATARVIIVRPDGTRAESRYSAIANVVPGKHAAVFLAERSVDGPARVSRGRRSGQLTLREQESLRLVAMGMTTTVAAERLGISPETVR